MNADEQRVSVVFTADEAKYLIAALNGEEHAQGHHSTVAGLTRLEEAYEHVIG